jgi:hypothetical protein
LFPVGLALSIAAWVMGQNDLRKISRRAMDPEGQGQTQAGWVCGIIGTIVNGLCALGCVGFFGMILAEQNRWNTTTRPRPTPVRPAPWPNDGKR